MTETIAASVATLAIPCPSWCVGHDAGRSSDALTHSKPLGEYIEITQLVIADLQHGTITVTAEPTAVWFDCDGAHYTPQQLRQSAAELNQAADLIEAEDTRQP